MAPFHCACEPAMKFEPLIVSVKPAPPAGAEAGFSVAIDGTGFWPGAVIVKESVFDAPPPGAGLTTATLAAPAAAMSAAPICAVSLVLFTKLVGRALPFHVTCAPGMNPSPLTVSVNAAPPACAEAGARLYSAGIGLAACSATTALSTNAAA